MLYALKLKGTPFKQFEEDMQEQQLLRTALKERIDHLTKLILTSSSMSSQALLQDWVPHTLVKAVSKGGFRPEKSQELIQTTVITRARRTRSRSAHRRSMTAV